MLWQTEDVTSMLPAIAMRPRGPASACALRLTLRGQEVVLDEQRPNIAIGRAEDNDLRDQGNLISRLHARIEVNRNKFVLIDQSTNGTFVQAEGGRGSLRPPRQHADQRRRAASASGRCPERDSPLTIRFVCEE